MKRDDLREGILELLGRRPGSVLTSRELGEALSVPGKAAKRVQKVLSEMITRGEIVRIRGSQYALGETANLVTGTLRLLRSGKGIVAPADGSAEVWVEGESTGTALPGDRVVVRLAAGVGRREGDERRREGKIIRVLERVDRDIVGTLRASERFLYVVPIDPIYRHNIYVPDAAGAALGDRVLVRFTAWENRHVNPEGEIVEVLGPADQPTVDTLSIIRQHRLREEFPEEVVREAEQARHLAEQPGRRIDLRGEYILTIDPERARDFDDALSLKLDADGRRVLGVHIADVGHFVRTGTALDEEARVRGNSVYLPDKVLPMLPEQLSNGVCSLRPDEDRLAFSAFITFGEDGAMLGASFAKTLIRSRARLTYEQAFDLLPEGPEGGRPRKSARPAELDAEGVALLHGLNRLAQELRAARFGRYALELDVPECEIVMDAQSVMTGIRVVDNDISHQLIEECMVAANEAVATHLRNNQVPSLYRIHDPPDAEKLDALSDQLLEMGYRPGNLHSRKVLAGFLRKVADDPFGYDVRVAVLRSMKRAVYAAEASEHFGLAKSTYTHFTSPIRRYPDLVVHRQLQQLLVSQTRGARDAGGEEAPAGQAGRRWYYGREELATVAQSCSETERRADEAERALTEIKKYRFLEAEIARGSPASYEAIVVSVTNFGMFVEVPSLQMQGLVHVSQVSDQFVRFNREKQALEAGRVVFRRAQRLRVIPSRVDFDSRRIDFKLVAEREAPRTGRTQGGPSQGGGRPPAVPQAQAGAGAPGRPSRAGARRSGRGQGRGARRVRR